MLHLLDTVSERIALDVPVAAPPSVACQTEPTKGRGIRIPLPEVGARHRRTIATDTMFPFQHIAAPYVCGASEDMQRMIYKEGIKCSLVHGNEPNRLFRTLKDITPPLARSMVTFSIHCATCGGDIYFNTCGITVAQTINMLKAPPVQPSLSTKWANANRNHQMLWSKPNIVMAHTTSNKAIIALGIIQDVVALECTAAHYNWTKGRGANYTENMRKVIRASFEK